MNIKPLDDFRILLDALPNKDDFASTLVQKRINDLTFPNSSLGPASLGKLAEFVKWIAAWRGYDNLTIDKSSIALFAGSNQFYNDSETIKKIVLNLQTGGAFVNNLCQNFSIILRIYDLALDYPVSDIRQAEAMDERGCAATMAFGLEAIAGDIELLGVSAIAGATINEAAIAWHLFGGEIKDWLPQPGEINIASFLPRDGENDSFSLVQKLGTRELAACLGSILAARMQKIPVILEGYTALLAACLLKTINKSAIEHCIIAQVPNLECYQNLAKFTELITIMDLSLEQSCGTGLAFAISMLKNAAYSFSNLHDFKKSEELAALQTNFS